MNLISEINEKIKIYRFIKEIHLSRNLDDESGTLYNLELVLSSFPCINNDVFTIIFERLRNICFGDLNNRFAVGIKIEDISSYQLESIQYKVEEVGEELFSFYCSTIRIV